MGKQSKKASRIPGGLSWAEQRKAAPPSACAGAKAPGIARRGRRERPILAAGYFLPRKTSRLPDFPGRRLGRPRKSAKPPRAGPGGSQRGGRAHKQARPPPPPASAGPGPPRPSFPPPPRTHTHTRARPGPGAPRGRALPHPARPGRPGPRRLQARRGCAGPASSASARPRPSPPPLLRGACPPRLGPPPPAAPRDSPERERGLRGAARAQAATANGARSSFSSWTAARPRRHAGFPGTASRDRGVAAARPPSASLAPDGRRRQPMGAARERGARPPRRLGPANGGTREPARPERWGLKGQRRRTKGGRWLRPASAPYRQGAAPEKPGPAAPRRPRVCAHVQPKYTLYRHGPKGVSIHTYIW